MATEVELKLQILETNEADALKQLERVLGVTGFKPTELRNIYFDTPDFSLNSKRIALRIRYQQNHFIQTLKTKGTSVNGLHQRGEWEWGVDAPELDVVLLNNCEAWPASIDTSLLIPVFETNFTRHQLEFTWTDSVGKVARIELAVDAGAILVANQSESISEIELELLTGESSTLLELGQYLFDSMPVKYADVSKAERGYRLFESSLI